MGQGEVAVLISALEFEIITREKISWIHGCIDGVEVTRASFKECDDPFRRELVQMDTPPEYQRKGYALALLRYLARAEPQGPLIDSPVEMNSEEGIAGSSHLGWGLVESAGDQEHA